MPSGSAERGFVKDASLSLKPPQGKPSFLFSLSVTPRVTARWSSAKRYVKPLSNF